MDKCAISILFPVKFCISPKNIRTRSINTLFNQFLLGCCWDLLICCRTSLSWHYLVCKSLLLDVMLVVTWCTIQDFVQITQYYQLLWFKLVTMLPLSAGRRRIRIVHCLKQFLLSAVIMSVVTLYFNMLSYLSDNILLWICFVLNKGLMESKQLCAKIAYISCEISPHSLFQISVRDMKHRRQERWRA